MRTGVLCTVLESIEILVKTAVGLLVGFIGFIAMLTAFYQLANVNFHLFSGSGVVFVVTLVVSGLLFWLAAKLVGGLVRRRQSSWRP